MSKNFEVKQAAVADIKAKYEQAKSVVMIDYRGMTVAEVTELRNQFRKNGCEYAVLKNTLVKLAAKEAGLEGFDPYLNGPTAVAFGMADAVAPAKVCKEFIEKAKKGSIKCGMVDGQLLDVKGVEALASIPSREVLLAKIMGSMMSAVSKFVYVVEALRKKQAGEEA